MLLYLLSLSDSEYHNQIVYLYRIYHDDMIRFAKYRLKLAGFKSYGPDAEDAVQSAFMKIAKYARSIDFEAGEQAVKAYVLAIVSNEAANIIAGHKEFDDLDSHEEDIADDSFMERLRINERYEKVVAAIEALDDKYSTVLLLRYREDMAVKKIAALLGISEKAVYARLERGKRMVLQKVGQEEGSNV